MPNHPTQHLPSVDPLADARALQTSIMGLRHLLAAQSRQLDAIERRLCLAGSPAETGAQRLRALKAGSL